jgi:hypothetical protein
MKFACRIVRANRANKLQDNRIDDELANGTELTGMNWRWQHDNQLFIM